MYRTREYLKSIISEVVRLHAELHIAVFEKTSKDGKIIERLIRAKEKEKDRARYATTTERLWTEIQGLQELLAMVKRHEQGKDLAGLAS